MNQKITVVTGAGTGIGKAITLRLAAEGHALALMARNVERLEVTAAQARDAGAPQVSVHGCDVRDQGAVETAFESAANIHGPLSGLIANAGIGGSNGPGEHDRFGDLVETNLMGTYHCFRAAQTHLQSGPQPRHLIAISSILGRFGVPGYTGYCASKTGILGLVRALSLEVASDNIMVNAICPGWVDTEMAQEGLDGMAAGMGISRDEAHTIAMSAVPVGRMGKPAHIAGTCVWLMSEDATGLTGQGIDINGGAWMG
jgi:NAD(P)-dependent dehydrogenase (short-subunit alcohol dehydrogenase family)